MNVKWMKRSECAHAFRTIRSRVGSVSLCGVRVTDSAFYDWDGVPGQFILDHGNNPMLVCIVCRNEIRERTQ